LLEEFQLLSLGLDSHQAILIGAVLLDEAFVARAKGFEARLQVDVALLLLRQAEIL